MQCVHPLAYVFAVIRYSELFCNPSDTSHDTRALIYSHPFQKNNFGVRRESKWMAER